jgi:hypothetical protein
MMEFAGRGSTIGAHYVMNEDPCYSDAHCKYVHSRLCLNDNIIEPMCA